MNKRIILGLLGLLVMAGQVGAQRYVELHKETFDGYGFNGNYVKSTDLPTIPGLSSIEFAYTDDDGDVNANVNTYVITKNAVYNGGGSIGDMTTGSGYYLYAHKQGNKDPDKDAKERRKIYSVDVNVIAGVPITFSCGYAPNNIGGNFFMMASQDGVNTEQHFAINRQEKLAWTKCEYSITPSANGTITFSLEDKEGWDYAAHTFGFDDIAVTVSQKPITITSPATLANIVQPGTTVTLRAECTNAYQTGNYSYQWQVQESGGSWTNLTETGAAGTGSGTTSNTTDFSVTSNEEEIVNYRLAVDYSSGTVYSDIITVEYFTPSADYIFHYDFGGNWVSTDNTSSNGASGDWAIVAGNQPAMTTSYSYAPANGVYSTTYGQNIVNLERGNYLITKSSQMHNDLGSSAGVTNDHTSPNNAAAGYYALFRTESSGLTTLFSTDVAVDTDMKGLSFFFNAWFIQRYYRSTITLKVTGADGLNYSMDVNHTEPAIWREISLPFTIPSGYTGTEITVSIVSTATGEPHQIGLDDISVTVDLKPRVSAPTTLSNVVRLNTEVPIEAQFNAYKVGAYSYVWQRQLPGGEWTAAVGTGTGTGAGTGTDFTTAAFSVTSATSGIFNYRLAVNYDGNTFYSDIITVEYLSSEYIFKYDFGGNWVSTTDPNASGDWAVIKGNEPSITTGYTYAPNNGSYSDTYGQNVVAMATGTYLITKGSQMHTAEGSGIGVTDHTFPDESIGYYGFFRTSNSGPTTLFSADITVDTGMQGKSYSLNAWVKQRFYYPTMTLKAVVGSATYSLDFNHGDPPEWREMSLLFTIPSDYTGDITISVWSTATGQPHQISLDDISITLYNPSVTITAPATGSEVGSTATFTANYDYTSPAPYYKWQTSSSGTGGWSDVTNVAQTSGYSGTISTDIGLLTTGYYRVVLSNSSNFTDLLASDPIYLTRGDYAYKEDFGGCGATDYFLPKDLNTYTVRPLYDDSGDSEKYRYYDGGETHPDLVSLMPRQYIIGKQVFQQQHGGGSTIGFRDITDHSSCGDGYFFQVHPTAGKRIAFFEQKLEVCGGSRYAFSAWLANVSAVQNIDLQFDFVVTFDSGGTFTYPTEGIPYASDPEWQYKYYEFPVPPGATTATFSIQMSSETDWTDYCSFTLDDVLIKQLPVSIVSPATTAEDRGVAVLSGITQTLTGQYSCGGLTGTNLSYHWEVSTDDGATWNTEGETTTEANANIQSIPFTTGVITQTTYYRLAVTGDGTTLYSDPVKFYPIEVTGKSYWVCPDNMTTDEATYAHRKMGVLYYPSMVPEEPGYLPSLISMSVVAIEGVTYKWYDADGTLLKDGDTYKEIEYASTGEVERPRLESDGKTNTLSVQNERNTEGIFNERTYYVEICDASGNKYADLEKVAIYLKQSYICASTETVVSPANARRLHRENFGGTATSDPAISITPLTGIDYNLYSGTENVPEGSYKVSKPSPTHEGWFEMDDHIYDLANENPHGYVLAVNATPTPGLYYTYTIENLGACRNIELAFAGWFTSPLGGVGFEKANLKFELINTDTGEVVAEFFTGNLIDNSRFWRQFGFKFFVPEGVTSLTLNVINNSFGTSYGNDVLIDDIEVYLVMPPVELVPSMDEYICSLTAVGEATLQGTYQDDGTLGKKLDYRWEFRALNSTVWKALPGTDEDGRHGTVTSGVITIDASTYFIDEFDSDNDGDYRLVVAQGQIGAFANEPLNYDCMAISESRQLIFAYPIDAPPTPSLENNPTAFCYSDVDAEGYITITNQDTTPNYEIYSWIVDQIIIPNNSQNELKLKLADFASGYHTVTLTAFNTTGCANTSIHKFIIFPKQTTWTAEGDPNSWNDYRNWTNGVPGACTDVIIPNEAISLDLTTLLDHYPDLLKPTTETLNEDDYAVNQANLEKQQQAINDPATFSLRPACNIIDFKMGGAVARTDYLKYTSAKVELDLKPGRWYTLSAPLRDMYSGDYYEESSVKRQNPIVYMMKYNTTNPQTQDTPAKTTGDFSNPFNTLNQELYPGLGFAVSVDNIQEPDRLQQFRFPRDAEKYTMYNYHGLEVGEVTIPSRTYIGRFTYEKYALATEPNYTDGVLIEEFTTDNTPVKEDKSDYTTMIVGNPFMSHISYTEFKKANSSVVGGYYIWKGDTQVYDPINPELFKEDDPDIIAPMQSFIVAKSGLVTSLKFRFDMMVTPTSATTPGSVLTRSSVAAPSVLQMEVLSNDNVQSRIRLKHDPSQPNAFDPKKDMWTLFSEEITEPAVLYALVNGKAASIRTIGDWSQPVELGIRTSSIGPLTLRLSGIETYGSEYDFYLEDRLTGTTQDLRVNPEYTFNNQIGNVQGRLFLIVDDGTRTGITAPSEGDNDIQVYADHRVLHVTSPAGDPIESIRVYSANGSTLAYKHGINQSSYAMNSPVHSQVVVVAVTTQGRKRTVKVMVK